MTANATPGTASSTASSTPSSFVIHIGAADSAVILHAPHGSRHIPPDARGRILLDDAGLRTELDHMTDAHTALIALGAAERTAAGTVVVPGVARPWVFEHRVSRLVVDPERFPDEREEMAAVGMGAVYTRTSQGAVLREDDPAYADTLLARYFRPYAQAMTELVDERLAAAGRAVIIDVHSYPAEALPYELHADGPRPRICLGTDVSHTPDWLLSLARKTFSAVGQGTDHDANGQHLALNTPFTGCYVPLKHYGADRRVSALMIEIRRDVYMSGNPDAPLNTSAFDDLCAALAELVTAADSVRAENPEP